MGRRRRDRMTHVEDTSHAPPDRALLQTNFTEMGIPFGSGLFQQVNAKMVQE